MLSIDKKLTSKIKYIAKHFGEWSVKDETESESVIWFVTFDRPDMSYEFEASRFGVSSKGRFVWDGTSGCSCPSHWHEGLQESDYIKIKETIELPEKEYGHYLDKDWLEQLTKSVDRIYLSIKSPEKLTAEQVLDEENTELRRVLIEKMGMERFVELAKPELLDDDLKVGSLLKINLKDDEPVILLSVKDSSTDRKYLLRVPPDMKTAKQAKAWTFGFEESDFTLTKET